MHIVARVFSMRVFVGKGESSSGEGEADFDMEVETSAERHWWTGPYAQSTETGDRLSCDAFSLVVAGFSGVVAGGGRGPIAPSNL